MRSTGTHRVGDSRCRIDVPIATRLRGHTVHHNCDECNTRSGGGATELNVQTFEHEVSTGTGPRATRDGAVLHAGDVALVARRLLERTLPTKSKTISNVPGTP